MSKISDFPIVTTHKDIEIRVNRHGTFLAEHKGNLYRAYRLEDLTEQLNKLLASEAAAKRRRVSLPVIFARAKSIVTATVTGVHAKTGKLLGKNAPNDQDFYPDIPEVRALLPELIKAREALNEANGKLFHYRIRFGGSQYRVEDAAKHMQVIDELEANYQKATEGKAFPR